MMDEDAAELARSAGLHYTFDDEPGLTRRRRGRGFSYVDLDGQTVPDDERARIEARWRTRAESATAKVL